MAVREVRSLCAARVQRAVRVHAGLHPFALICMHMHVRPASCGDATVFACVLVGPGVVAGRLARGRERPVHRTRRGPRHGTLRARGAAGACGCARALFAGGRVFARRRQRRVVDVWGGRCVGRHAPATSRAVHSLRAHALACTHSRTPRTFTLRWVVVHGMHAQSLARARRDSGRPARSARAGRAACARARASVSGAVAGRRRAVQQRRAALRPRRGRVGAARRPHRDRPSGRRAGRAAPPRRVQRAWGGAPRRWRRFAPGCRVSGGWSGARSASWSWPSIPTASA